MDLVIEASGHPSAVSDSLVRLVERGTLLQMGVVGSTALIDLFPYDLFDRELRIIRSQSLATSYPAAVESIDSLPGLASRMVTHPFGLDQYAEALAAPSSESAREAQILPHASDTECTGELPGCFGGRFSSCCGRGCRWHFGFDERD